MWECHDFWNKKIDPLDKVFSKMKKTLGKKRNEWLVTSIFFVILLCSAFLLNHGVFLEQYPKTADRTKQFVLATWNKKNQTTNEEKKKTIQFL